MSTYGKVDAADGMPGDYAPHRKNCRCEECGHDREVTMLRDTIAEQSKWIDDLQSQMYINCVYCGKRYGPNTRTPMRSTLEAHISECPKHPLAAAKRRIAKLESWRDNLRKMHPETSFQRDYILNFLDLLLANEANVKAHKSAH